MSAKNVKKVVDNNVITPLVPGWSRDRWAQQFKHLIENPSYEQLEIYEHFVEELYDQKQLATSLFVLLFKELLDRTPEPPPMTLEQHVDLYTQFVEVCNNFAIKWQEEFYARTKEGFHV